MPRRSVSSNIGISRLDLVRRSSFGVRIREGDRMFSFQIETRNARNPNPSEARAAGLTCYRHRRSSPRGSSTQSRRISGAPTPPPCGQATSRRRLAGPPPPCAGQSEPPAILCAHARSGLGHRRGATRQWRAHPSVDALAGEGARGGAATTSTTAATCDRRRSSCRERREGGEE